VSVVKSCNEQRNAEYVYFIESTGSEREHERVRLYHFNPSSVLESSIGFSFECFSALVIRYFDCWIVHIWDVGIPYKSTNLCAAAYITLVSVFTPTLSSSVRLIYRMILNYCQGFRGL
jgi:hypothetical protein